MVNLSYGWIGGPHDGSEYLAAAMEEIIASGNAVAPFTIVLPSGNNRQLRCHAQWRFSGPGDAKVLRWRVLPDNRAPSYLEIWLPEAPGQVEVRLTPPGGTASAPIWPDEVVPPQGSPPPVWMVAYTSASPTGSRYVILIALAPTASLDRNATIAPSGEWLVTLTNDTASSATHNPFASSDPIDAWIRRNDTPYGYPQRGRQSYFDDPAYERYDAAGRPIDVDSGASAVKRDGTLSAIATGSLPVVVGGFRRGDLTVASYWAGGPAGSTDREGPEALAVSDDSAALFGVRAAGTLSGSSGAMDGTSVAAPQVARWIVRKAGQGLTPQNPWPPSYRGAVRTKAQNGEAYLPAPHPSPERGGGGRIVTLPQLGAERLRTKR